MKWFKTLISRNLEICLVCKKAFEVEHTLAGGLFCREHREEELKKERIKDDLYQWINAHEDICQEAKNKWDAEHPPVPYPSQSQLAEYAKMQKAAMQNMGLGGLANVFGQRS